MKIESKNSLPSTAVKPLRILNEPAGFMGLSSLDLCAIGYFLVIGHSALSAIGLGPLAFLISGVFAYELIAVRLKYRRKIIRDFILKLLTSRVIYDPKA